MHALLLSALLVFTMTDPAGIEQPEDYEPVTSSASSVVDPYGDTRFSDVDDPSQETWTGSGLSPGPAIATVFTGGLVNGDFAAGPKFPDQPISDDNRLPGWSYVVVQGGSMTARWITDASSLTGYAVEFSAPTASADDEVYLEQIIPITPRARVFAPEMVIGAATGSSGSILVDLSLQPLAYDGTTTGTEVTAAAANSAAAGAKQAVVGIPSDARFLRIRLGYRATGSVTDMARPVYEVWAGSPQITYTTLVASAVSLPATGTQTLNLVSANSSGTPVSAAERFVMPANGWIASVSVAASTTMTGTSIEFSVLRVLAGSDTGPVVTLDTGEQFGYATAFYDTSTNALSQADRLAIQASIPSGTLTSTTADVVVIATVAYVLSLAEAS